MWNLYNAFLYFVFLLGSTVFFILGGYCIGFIIVAALPSNLEKIYHILMISLGINILVFHCLFFYWRGWQQILPGSTMQRFLGVFFFIQVFSFPLSTAVSLVWWLVRSKKAKFRIVFFNAKITVRWAAYYFITKRDYFHMNAYPLYIKLKVKHIESYQNFSRTCNALGLGLRTLEIERRLFPWCDRLIEARITRHNENLGDILLMSKAKLLII